MPNKTISPDIRQKLQKIKPARVSLGLTQDMLGRILGATQSTIALWETERSLPKPEHLERIDLWLRAEELKPHAVDTQKEIREHCQQLKHLLNLLEFHLRYFQNEKLEAREAYRQELDVYDVGYLTSLLEMLFDETKFQHWKVFTTHQFEGFRRRKHGRKGEDKSESG